MFPYYSASQFYKDMFGCKAYKIAIDAGCTCPNRDGTKGYGGCIFCSQKGSGDFVSDRALSITEQIESAKERVKDKVYGRSGEREGRFIAYFQNFTSTYGYKTELVAKYKEALNCKDVAGLDIATRPDCIGDDILNDIAVLAREHFVTVELGFQTCRDDTGVLINRQYTTNDYLDAVKRIKEECEKAGSRIHIVTHVIAGLPGETQSDFLESVKTVVKAKSDGIKITVLYVLKNTVLNSMYESGNFKTLSLEEYSKWLIEALKVLPPEIVVHRVTGDPPKSEIVSPLWTTDKRHVMNYLNKALKDAFTE